MVPRKPATTGVNKQYFRNLLRDRQLSQRQLAKLLEMDQSALVRAFQGKRAFQTSEAAKMSRLLNVPLDDILRNLDVDVPMMREHKGGTVPVKGYVMESYIEFKKASGPAVVPAPPHETGGGMLALRCADASVFEGAYFYYRPADTVQADAIGRLSVCRIADGRYVLATPRPTGRANFTLRDVAGRVLLEEAWLESASPVIWIKTA
jgi:transcriptional regulator with XRE-family HTH domain